jgi:hypothetical protein
MRLEKLYRNLAAELNTFASGQRGQGRDLLLSAATALEVAADGTWAPYSPAEPWLHSEEHWFLVYSPERGIQIAERGDEGWTNEIGDVLEGVTHWRYLPVPPSGNRPSDLA